MSYKLKKPYTDIEYANFIAEYNHRGGLKIAITDDYVYALKDNEMMNENNEPVVNPNYAAEKAAERKEKFESEFFETSLGWIRRKVTMKDGSTKDFLGDLLIPVKAGLELGQEVEIITYKTPDFTEEYTSDYIISLQERKAATAEFVQECLMQVVKDFGG